MAMNLDNIRNNRPQGSPEPDKYLTSPSPPRVIIHRLFYRDLLLDGGPVISIIITRMPGSQLEQY